MNINGSFKFNKAKKFINPKLNIKLNFPLSPKNPNINVLKQKYIRFSKLPKTLSNKLNNKIIKEALILGLREEFIYNEKMKLTLEDYLSRIIALKLQVKKNKEEVESNCDKLKLEFQEKFVVVDNFEKRIELLNEEKKEIIKTNEEIIKLKMEQNNLLKKQFNKVQEDANQQMEEIKKLKVKINELTNIKLNLNSELEKEQEIEEEKYKELIKEFVLLTKKFEYYQIEYDKFDMFPQELIKKNINLYDNTLTNEILTEENLKIKLYEQNFIRDELINNKQIIKEKVDKLEEEQNELKRREEKYGKNLDVNQIMRNKKNTNKNLKINTKNIKTRPNYDQTLTTKSNKRMKTVENKLNIVF